LSTKINLREMPKNELVKLQGRITAELKKHDVLDRKKAASAVKDVLSKFGMTLPDIVDFFPNKPGPKTGSKHKKKRKITTASTPGPARYQDPNDEANKWTGKGRRPVWFLDAMAAGHTPEDLEIKGN